MAEGQNNEDNNQDNEVELHIVDVCPLFTALDSWYRDLVHYLQEGYLPEHQSPKQRRALCLKSVLYHIIDGLLFRRNYDGVFLRCLEHEDANKVVAELHDGPTGGHFSGDTTTHKILRAGYYWTTLFRDAHAHVRKCDTCQRCIGRQAKAVGPLKPVIILEPFEQWGIDIIGEINPNSSLQHKYILKETNYFTRWVEAITLQKVNEDAVMDFLQNHIMTRFGVPISLVFYNASYFSSIKLTAFANER